MTDAFIVSAAAQFNRGEGNPPATLSGLTGALVDEALSQARLPGRRTEAIIWGGADLPVFPGAVWPMTRVESGFCSGQLAVHLAVQGILAGDQETILAGGAAGEPSSLEEEADRLGRYIQVWDRSNPIEDVDLHAFALRYFQNVETVETAAGGAAPGQVIPSGMGAAALGLVSARTAGRLNLAPRGRLAGRAMAADQTPEGWDSILSSTRLAMSRAGVEAADLGVVCLQTAYLGVILSWLRAFEMDETRLLRIPVLSGPASGSVGLVKVLETLETRALQYGLVVSSGLDGWSAATVVERI
jgi:acetyl-CoA acetyltransferase